MASSLIIDYLGRGLAAARPATPPVGLGVAAFYYATDTGVLSVWDGAAWDTIGGGAIRVEDEGSTILAAASAFNFAGAGVSVTDAGSGEALVTIPGGGSAFGEFAYRPPTAAGLATNVVAPSVTFTKTDVAGKGLSLQVIAGASGRAAGAFQSVPSLPITVSTRFSAAWLGGPGSMFAGICLRNSSNGRCVMLYRNSDSTVYLQNWTDINTFAGSLSSRSLNPVFQFGGALYLAVHVSASGDVTPYVSNDGVIWEPWSGTTLAAYLTAAGGSFDQIGFWQGIFGAASNGIGSLVSYWRVDAIDPPAVALT